MSVRPRAGRPGRAFLPMRVLIADAFEASGFAALRSEWEALHAHAGQRLRMRLADGRVLAGTHEGIAEDGALQLRTRDGLRTLHSARIVSARPA